MLWRSTLDATDKSVVLSVLMLAADINPRDYRAWYGLGQIYEMMHLYKYAVHYYKKAATCR